MARKRMIDPAIWESEQVMALSARQFKLYVYLITHSDDEGRMRVSFPMIASRAFPMDASIDAETVKSDVEHMHDIDLVLLYGDSQYLMHPNWTRYQTINRPTESRIPSPDECSVNTHGGLSEDSVSAHGGLTPKRREEKRREEKGTQGAREPARESWGENSLEKASLQTFQQREPMWKDTHGNLDAIPKLVELAATKGDPAKVLPAMVRLYFELIDGLRPKMAPKDKQFWGRQPPTPKRMLSLWDSLVGEASYVLREGKERAEDEAELDRVFGVGGGDDF